MDRKYLGRSLFAIVLIVGFSGSVLAAEIIASGRVILPSVNFTDVDREPEVIGDPFDRSIVSVAGSGSNYSYSASSDIGLTELKAFGQITNDTGGGLSEGELGLVTANARLEDTLTFESVGTEDYDVVFELQVDGFTNFNGGSGFVGGNLLTGSFSGQHDSFNIRNSGVVDVTMTVTRTFNGTVDATVLAQIFLQLNVADAGATLTAELSNTATLNVILPAGVTLTASESGTFGNVIPAPVPLPGALPLFVVALWRLTAMRKRV